MKKLLLGSIALGALMAAAPAGAADLRAPVYKAPPAPIWTWTGFYIGGHAGGGWGDKQWFNVDAAGVPFGLNEGLHHVRGGLAGGQVGFNYQVGYWVWGAEVDASWAALEGSNADIAFLVDLNHSRVESIATAAGKLGYAVDRVMAYAKFGGAWVHDKYWVSSIVTPDITRDTASQNRSGWMGGLGVEYAFAQNWSVKFEYNYLDLGHKRVAFTTPVGGVYRQDIDQQLSLFKFGINYRFGYGPVYAKY